MFDDFKKNSHPHAIFEQWYLESQGKGSSSHILDKVKSRLRFLGKQAFTQIVPSLDRMNYNAVVLATASLSGIPASRVVLLKGHSEKGYVFYTNYNSSKAQHLNENPVASLNFFWAYPTRQVRIFGEVKKVSRKTSQEYWASRPRGSQEGAMASEQSHEIQGYDSLKEQLKEVQEKYKGGRPIPCPQNWGGYIVKPKSYEFWQAMPDRLHQRVLFELINKKWVKKYLAP